MVDNLTNRRIPVRYIVEGIKSGDRTTRWFETKFKIN